MSQGAELLHAIVALVEEEASEIAPGTSSEGVVTTLLGEFPDGLVEVSVMRAMKALGITSVEEIEARETELTTAVQCFMDGFIIATRYTRGASRQ